MALEICNDKLTSVLQSKLLSRELVQVFLLNTIRQLSIVTQGVQSPHVASYVPGPVFLKGVPDKDNQSYPQTVVHWARLYNNWVCRQRFSRFKTSSVRNRATLPAPKLGYALALSILPLVSLTKR